MKKAKIIATLGPKVSAEPEIEALVAAGADAFRLNLSYDDTDRHDGLVQAVRTVETRVGKPLCLIADLAGPRYRIGSFAGGKIALTPSQTLRLDQDEAPGDETRVCLPHAAAFTQTSIGDMLRLDDGRVILRVNAVTPFTLTCSVVAGTELVSNKIISLPNSAPQRDKLSDKDKAQIIWAREAGLDWLTASWPTSALAWQEIRDNSGEMKLLAKMDSKMALANMAAAVEGADGLVVARGDLGYDVAPEEIPGVQKRLVQAARRAGKPVVIAAQMLESMVTNPAPTRAEASDVANAVRDGADALMLSAETAIGAYAHDAVEMMASVITTTEADGGQMRYDVAQSATIANTIARSAGDAADALSAPLIFCFTSSGNTALSVAQMRPKTTVVCASDSLTALRQMQLVWGLNCQLAPALTKWRDVVDTARSLAQTLEVETGAPLVITAGMPFGEAGSTNILRIATAP